ncbi:dicarboxylate/amino acid:cation symporter [Miniphocaeibacter halophilus]|uniref:Dicarboxylate/amino acid:cation symporter n=1 Tax=Miniphocaeibacter halophilus TaxID=2931922 RepID=A0AC61MPN7_9FIRM|nr:dicarboxylate/amino acid:cation symporter [Miniphocaeibacter halophilus]QQK07479.1 dicarboxylate/amino acid:cation symporter [Miniphocaeibacter halophilus]
MKKKFKLGLIPKLIIAIILGVLTGLYLPKIVTQVAVTFSSFFSQWLSFVIPLMILAFVTKGIADLSEGAGKLLGVTVLIAYTSTLLGGTLSWIMSDSIFPKFITADAVDQITKAAGDSLEPIFSVELKPFFDVTGALVFAFVFGLSISWLRNKGKGEYSYGFITEFNEIISNILAKAVVPVLPFYIFGNFANMAYSGSVFAILSIFWKIFILIVTLHLLYVSAMFIISGSYTGKNPIRLIKNQISGYITALGTQSSAATIPVNLECARKDGVSKGIRDFVIPLGATVHMPGSMITITACTYTILAMYGMPNGYTTMIPYIAILGIAMVAAPGAPGGAVMSALPFLPVVGIDPGSGMATLLISLYTTQDSFGTAANISGDNAIAVAVDKIYYKHIVKREKTKEELES